MQQIENCTQCNQPFDSYGKYPCILNCQHKICFQCAVAQFQQRNNIQCRSCGMLTYTTPPNLQKDNEILQKLSAPEVIQAKDYRLACDVLRQHKNKNKENLIKICQKKQVVTEQVMILLEQILFKNTNELYKTVQQNQNNTDKSINDYLTNATRLEQRAIPANNPWNPQTLVNKQYQNDLEYQCQREIIRLEKILTTLSKRLESTLFKMCPQQDPQTQIWQKSNQFSLVNTFESYTKNQISYNIQTKQKSQQEMNIPENTQDDLTYIEQINDQTVIISGGFNGNRDYTILQQGNAESKQMIQERYWHRTMNALNRNFIVSGGQQNSKIKDCEAYYFQKKKFGSVADIPIPV